MSGSDNQQIDSPKSVEINHEVCQRSVILCWAVQGFLAWMFFTVERYEYGQGSLVFDTRYVYWFLIINFVSLLIMSSNELAGFANYAKPLLVIWSIYAVLMMFESFSMPVMFSWNNIGLIANRETGQRFLYDRVWVIGLLLEIFLLHRINFVGCDKCAKFRFSLMDLMLAMTLIGVLTIYVNYGRVMK